MLSLIFEFERDPTILRSRQDWATGRAGDRFGGRPPTLNAAARNRAGRAHRRTDGRLLWCTDLHRLAGRAARPCRGRAGTVTTLDRLGRSTVNLLALPLSSNNAEQRYGC